MEQELIKAFQCYPALVAFCLPPPSERDRAAAAEEGWPLPCGTTLRASAAYDTEMRQRYPGWAPAVLDTLPKLPPAVRVQLLLAAGGPDLLAVYQERLSLARDFYDHLATRVPWMSDPEVCADGRDGTLLAWSFRCVLVLQTDIVGFTL